MFHNIKFEEYTDLLTEKQIISKYDIDDIDDKTLILLNCISNTNIFTSNKALLKINTCNFIGTNISYYFGYTDTIVYNITKNNINDLLCNILITHNTNILWSNLIIKYYNKYFHNYTNKQVGILNNLLNEIRVLYYKIIQDVKLLDKKKFELDIVHKSIYEYMSENLNSILDILFNKIHIFYILSICFSNISENYLLIYDKNIINKINEYLY